MTTPTDSQATDPSWIGGIIGACFARPLVVVVLSLAAGAAGTASFFSLQRDVFPDLSAPVFSVIVQNAAMSPEELETGVVIPLESALAGLPEVRRVRSTCQLGVATTVVEFEPDANYHKSRTLVAERLGEAASRLPVGTDPPLLSSLTGRLNEVFELTLEADAGALDLMALRDLAEHEVKNRLLAVPGVAAVERLGGFLRQFQVQIDRDRMSARGITLQEVLHAVEGANENASGGILVQGPTEWSVRAVGRASTIEELRTTVVALRGDTPVLLGDVAEVREAPALRRGLAHRLQGEVVSCRVSKQFGADTIAVASGIRGALAGLQGSLPPGVQVRTVYDQSVIVEEAISGVGRAVLLGAGFAVLVILLLLGNWRAALVVTATIPLSIAAAGWMLERLDLGLNTMTLGGLAVAVGLLVDASIIMTENIVHRLSAGGAPAMTVARRAAVEVGRPIAFATAIVLAVFLPLFAMTGIEGRLYAPLAVAVVASMAASLVLSITLTPILAYAVLRRRGAATAEVRAILAIRSAYARVLDWCLRRAGWVRALTLVATVPALVVALGLGSDFMPRIDEGALLLQTNLPAEASLDEVDRLNHRVEDLLRDLPEVEDVVRRTGRAERTEDPMPHTLSDVLVVLKSERRRSIEELEEKMRARVEKVPGVTVMFTTPLGMRIDEGLGGTPADLAVRVFGPDLEVLARLAERVATATRPVAGIEDLRVERSTGLPQVRITVDRAAAARAGLTPGEIVRAVRIGLVGEEAAEVWVGQQRFDLVMRLMDHQSGDLAAIRSLLVDGHDGTRIPLGHLASIDEVTGPGSIKREAGSRRLAVEASVRGRDLGSVARDVREAVRGLELPPGYFVEVGGRVEQQERALRALWMAALFAGVAVFLLLYLALGSVAETLVILATLPDAMVGGVLALLLVGETWSVSSLVGLIALLGIAVQNGLVLVTQVRGLRAQGRPFEEALREACVARVRPKLMTAGTAILGLLPLAVLPLPGTEIERPLAVVMVGGLVTSTLFTLLALPTFYALVERLRGLRVWSGAASTGPNPPE